MKEVVMSYLSEKVSGRGIASLFGTLIGMILNAITIDLMLSVFWGIHIPVLTFVLAYVGSAIVLGVLMALTVALVIGAVSLYIYIRTLGSD